MLISNHRTLAHDTPDPPICRSGIFLDHTWIHAANQGTTPPFHRIMQLAVETFAVAGNCIKVMDYRSNYHGALSCELAFDIIRQ